MKTLLLLAAFFVVFQASSQQWYSYPANNGRDVNCIKLFNRDTTIIAGGWEFDNGDSSRAFYRSDNGGLFLWNVPDFDPGHWITSLDFTDLQNGIAVGKGGRILTTSNAGLRWTTSNAPLNRDLNKIFFIDAQNMIIVGGKKGDTTQASMQTVFRSTNGGQTWNVALDQPGFWLKAVYFPTPSTGYAVGDSGTILKTTDGGMNWNPITPPIQRNFNGIWFSDSNHGIIVGGFPAHDSIRTILQTTNGGNSWTINTDQQGGMLRDVHFYNTTNGYAVGDYASVYQTTDRGQIWNPVVIPGTTTEQFNAVRFYSSDFGYVSGKGGVNFIYNDEAAPEVFTSGSVVSDSLTVTLNGFTNAHGEIAAQGFVYSWDFDSAYYQTNYPSYTRSAAPAPFQETFTNLLPNRQYSYFSEAWTKGGTVYGDTLTFYTGAAISQIITLPATNVPDSTTFNGAIRGFSNPINLFFEYGTTPALGSQIVATPASVNDTALQNVTGRAGSLQINTLYYYRLKGVSGTSDYFGNIETFFNGEAPALYTMLQTLPATYILDTSATLNAMVAGFTINADVTFEYGSDSLNLIPAPGVSFVRDTGHYSFSAMASNLAPATLYYFRVKAQTPLGTFYGNLLHFYSGITGNYFVKTKAATGITITSAQLHGEVHGFTEAVNLSFEYGTTLAMNDSIAGTPATVNDTDTHAVTASLSGLQSNTLYYYRLKAEVTSAAKFYGETKQIYTGYNTIPNWDFQDWEQKTFTVPERWNIFGNEYEQVPGHSGNYAMKVFGSSMAILGIFYDSGQDDGGFIGGVPFRARPDSISFYANYDIEPGDSGVFLAFLYDTAYNTVAGTFIPIVGNSNGQFKRLSFPIEYSLGSMPDSLVLAFIPTNPDHAKLNNYIIVDDITASPASPPIQNADFETWIDLSENILSSWFYPIHVMLNGVQPAIITQAIFNAPGDYAAELQNVSLGNGRYGGTEISNRNGLFNKDISAGGFPVYARHQTLNGYYKWLPEGGDSMLIDVQFRYQRQSIGNGRFTTGVAAPDFTVFDIPINYWVSGVTPDTAEITIRSYSRNPPKGASHLLVDKLSFDGFVGIDEDNIMQEQSSESLRVYPNPASTDVVIQLSREVKGNLKVCDINGKIVYTKDFSGNKVSIDTRNFSRGFYIISVEEGGKRMTNRLIVVR